MKPRDRIGLFIVFEGIDGTGKTTQIRLLAKYLQQRSLQVILTREPSDGPIGRRIRSLFSRRHEISPRQELQLFIDDRREHVEQVIVPSLKLGKVVLCDRYYYSTAAYQGAAGLDPDEILHLNRFAPRPDLVFLLELSPELAVARIQQSRGEKLNDFEQLEQLQRVAHNFERFDDACIRRINANAGVEEVQAAVKREVDFLLEERRITGS